MIKDILRHTADVVGCKEEGMKTVLDRRGSYFMRVQVCQPPRIKNPDADRISTLQLMRNGINFVIGSKQNGTNRAVDSIRVASNGTPEIPEWL